MMDELRRKYIVHKNNAAARGVEFALSFDDWMDIWAEHLHNRGRNVGQFGMLRTRDEGGYTLGNVRIGTVKENRQEASVAHRVRTAQNIKTPSDYRMKPPTQTSWVGSRHNVFKEYSEEDE